MYQRLLKTNMYGENVNKKICNLRSKILNLQLREFINSHIRYSNFEKLGYIIAIWAMHNFKITCLRLSHVNLRIF